MHDACFRANAPTVIYEVFDGELVAIHLDTGAYHSLMGAAADAFLLLTQEATATEIAEALATKYDAQPGDIARVLVPFFEALLAEQLIVPVETRTERGPLRLDVPGEKLPFTPPNLEAYHDLQSLFLLDPVHEVGEEGWPQPQAKESQ